MCVYKYKYVCAFLFSLGEVQTEEADKSALHIHIQFACCCWDNTATVEPVSVWDPPLTGPCDARLPQSGLQTHLLNLCLLACWAVAGVMQRLLLCSALKETKKQNHNKRRNFMNLDASVTTILFFIP